MTLRGCKERTRSAVFDLWRLAIAVRCRGARSTQALHVGTEFHITSALHIPDACPINEESKRGASLSAPAYAKINLTLDVLGRRDDGYHELQSLVVGLELHDTVRCARSQTCGVTLSCTDASLAGPDNLASLAAASLARHLDRDPAVEITLDKAIPVGGGMGGGSSDAAATLRLCDQLWEAGLDSRQLAEIGAELGADVSLFFALPSAVVSGRGEIVRRVAMRWSGWAMLVFVPEVVSTAAVYAAWRKSDSRLLPRDRVDAILASSSATEFSESLSNDLTSAVLRVSPRVADTFHQINQKGLGPMIVSGAGSTLYKLFDEKEAACRSASAIEQLDLDVTTLVTAAPFG